MNSKKNLVFLGMMGSGKSSIGRLISKKLNLSFFDIDNLVEKDAGMSTSDIFEKKGENYFRMLEQRITTNQIKSTNSVIALGGGAFINDEIRKTVLKNCISFWLDLSTDFLLLRITEYKKRPLLNKPNLKETLEKIYQERKSIYALANFKINCNKISKVELVEKIATLYVSK